ncbi:MAG: alkaline phosphatase D family protein [Acidobacteriota bacterium]|nr:alkaline phosphatase D family protein [Acidobacteriota bacterium]
MRRIPFFSCLSGLLLLTAFPALAGKGKLQSGPMIGYVDLMEVLIWVQTKAETRVQIAYRPQSGNRSWDVSETVVTQKDTYFTAHVILTDLKPETAYEYKVVLDDDAAQLSYPTTFKTQTFWRWRKDPPEISFAMGSCFFVNDPPHDRPGNPYGGDFEILTSIDKKRPDFFLWLGDNVYLREPDFYSETRLNYRYKHTRSLPGLQPLLARTPNYAIWDDHDFGPNDSDRAYGLKGITLKMFKAYWSNPHYGTPETPGVFGKFVWGDLDFFLLDDRYHRAPNADPSPDKDYLGAPQLQWLKDSLLSSRAAFKFVVNGNQVLNTRSPFEKWSQAAREYEDFMNFLDAHDIRGVVFLTGDRHHTELLKRDRPGNYTLYEFTSSPLTSGAVRQLRDSEKDNPLRVDGTLVLNKRNFGVLNVTGKRGSRVLTMKTYDKDGAELWSHSVRQVDLRKPGN